MRVRATPYFWGVVPACVPSGGRERLRPGAGQRGGCSRGHGSKRLESRLPAGPRPAPPSGASAWPVGWTPIGAVPHGAALPPGRALQRDTAWARLTFRPSSRVVALCALCDAHPRRPRAGLCPWGCPPLASCCLRAHTDGQEGHRPASSMLQVGESGPPNPGPPPPVSSCGAAVWAQALLPPHPPLGSGPPRPFSVQPSGWKPR